MFTYEIIKKLGTISTRTDKNGEEWTKEINIVAWNHHDHKVDIREWSGERMSKGVTFTEEEAMMLWQILDKHREGGEA